jgi:SAM-dependent methyltransferase
MATEGDATWVENYSTRRALDGRHEAWSRYARSEGLFGVDFVPALRDGARVLDVGCGTGVHLSALMHKQPRGRYFAMDLSPGMVAAARQACPSAEVGQGDVEELPCRDGAFDVVLCIHVMYHVKNIARALHEIRRVLRPDGVLVITSVSDGSGLELQRLHNQCCGQIWKAGWRAVEFPRDRFNTSNGGAMLQDVFSSVTFHPRHASLAFPTVESAMQYYTTMEFYKAASRDGPACVQELDTAMRRAIGKRLEEEGCFRVSKDCGTWVVSMLK